MEETIMLTMLIENERWLAFAQAMVSGLCVLLVIMASRRLKIYLVKETVIAMLRGIVQIVVVGSILLTMFAAPTWASLLILAVMITAASFMGAARLKNFSGGVPIFLFGVAISSVATIGSMVLLGVIAWETKALVPLGSMIIANTMNTNILGLERFRSEVSSHHGMVETALALGAKPEIAVAPYVQSAINASLIPQVNSLRSLGIVWIPGAMSGLVLAGADPVYAAFYQFVVVAMIYVAANIASVISILLMRKRIFSKAMQLLLNTDGTLA
ncbi:MAG TPA: ABC transporter permease [Chloroflexi bacterium]|nr:ABC transporter permease [Chloroflexota bacterium]